MQTMTIQYNPANALVQPIIELIQQVKGIKIISRSDEYVPDDETLEAVQDIKAGKEYHATSTDDLFQQILG